VKRGKLLKYEKKEVRNVDNGFVLMRHYIYEMNGLCEVYQLYGNWTLGDEEIAVDIEAVRCVNDLGTDSYMVDGEITRDVLDYYYSDLHFTRILEYSIYYSERARKVFEKFREAFNKLSAGGE